jgi:cell division protease FtsH
LQKTVFKSPADIENMIKEAALISIRKNKEFIEMQDLSKSMDKNRFRYGTALDMTAYHELGMLWLCILYIQQMMYLRLR